MAEASVKKLSIFDLQAKVDRGEKVFQVTAVDFPTAQLVDRAGIDCILIGDSLGMTALGYASTVPVTMDEMIHHAKAISRAVKRAIVVGDLPLGAYHACDCGRGQQRDAHVEGRRRRRGEAGGRRGFCAAWPRQS